MASERLYNFGEEVIRAPAEMAPEDVRATWAAVYPALMNAELVENEDGSVSFHQRGGTKGC